MNDEPLGKLSLKDRETNKSNKYYSPSKSANTTLSKSLTEEKAISLAFSQMVSQHSSQLPITMDKNQLFETFLLFQNFLNINQITLQSAQPNQFTISKSSDEERDTDALKGKPELDVMETISHKEDSGSKIIDNDNSRNNNSPNAKANGNEQRNSNNFDDIPIKPANTDFMELVEKTLANDNQNSSDKKNGTKKKVAKPVSYQKKTIQISKPSKHDKKYSYYTDTLEDNGKPNEENKPSKTLKTDHSSSRHTTQNSNRLMKAEKVATNHPNMKNMTISEQDNDSNRNPQKLFSGTKTETMKKKVRKAISTDYQSSKQKPSKEKIEAVNDSNQVVPQEAPLQKKEIIQHMPLNTQESERTKKVEEKLPEPLHTEVLQQSIQPTPLKQYIQFKKAHIEESKRNKTDKPSFKNNDTDQIPEQYEEENKDSQDKKQSGKEKIIEAKITELNLEISRFKEEKEKVDRLKDEYEKLHSKLQVDIDDLNTRKASFDDWKSEETKRIQKEKRRVSQEMKQLTSMKQMTQALQLSTKKDKDQIDALKAQITKLQNESKQKETSGKLIIDKLKKQIEELTAQQENKSTIIVNNQPILNSNNVSISEKAQPCTILAQKMVRARTGKLELKQKPPIARMQTITSKNSNEISVNVNLANMNSLNTIPHSKEDEEIDTEKIKKQLIQMNSTKPKSYATPFTQAIQNSIKTNETNEPNETYDFVIPEKYHSKEYHLLTQETSPDGKIIRMYNDDKREVIFQSGVRKEIYQDGYQIVYFSNGDLKQVFPNNKSVYYFKDAKTVQTIFSDGLQVFKFNNGQIEKHFTDGTKRISFPDGSIRNIFKEGNEETFFADGTIQKIDENNVITIEQVDGLKVIKYPDGKEECVYPEDD